MAEDTQAHSILEMLLDKKEQLSGALPIGVPDMPGSQALQSRLQELKQTQLTGLPQMPDSQALLNRLQSLRQSELPGVPGMPDLQPLVSQLEQMKQTQLAGVPTELLESAQGALTALQDELQSGRHTLNQALDPLFSATSAFGQSYRGSVDVSMLSGAAKGLLNVVTAPLGLFSSAFTSILFYTAFALIAVALFRAPRQ
jgi:hypothetical protein